MLHFTQFPSLLSKNINPVLDRSSGGYVQLLVRELAIKFQEEAEIKEDL
jgi:hypothetical protein